MVKEEMFSRYVFLCKKYFIPYFIFVKGILKILKMKKRSFISNIENMFLGFHTL